MIPRKRPAFRSLDLWRGIAALWVVAVHACLPYLLSVAPSLMRNPVYRVSVSGPLGVVLFFVISGYCIVGAAYNSTVADRPVRAFAFDQIRRIFPPYWAALALAIATIDFSQFLQRNHILPGTAVVQKPETVWFWTTNVFLVQIPAGYASAMLVAWTLSYEIAFYAVVGSWLAIARRLAPDNVDRRVMWLATGLGTTTLVSAAWMAFFPRSCPFPLTLWYQFGLGSWLFFLVVANDPTAGWLHARRGWIRALVPPIAILSLMVAGEEDAVGKESLVWLGHPSLRIQSIAAVLFAVVLFAQQPFDRTVAGWRFAKPLAWIGGFSYSLYLTHVTVLPFVDGALRRCGFHGAAYLVTFAAQILASVAVAWVFHRLVERRFLGPASRGRSAADPAAEGPMRGI